MRRRTRGGVELDSRGAGGYHGVVPRFAGNLEWGDDHEPGAEAVTAHGDRLRAVGCNPPSWADRNTDSLALWRDHQPEREAVCPGRRVAEDASGSRFPDSRNGGTSYLRRDRRVAQSCQSAQRVWSAIHQPARRVYLSAGRTGKSQGGLSIKVGWFGYRWFSGKLNKRCFVYRVY